MLRRIASRKCDDETFMRAGRSPANTEYAIDDTGIAYFDVIDAAVTCSAGFSHGDDVAAAAAAARGKNGNGYGER